MSLVKRFFSAFAAAAIIFPCFVGFAGCKKSDSAITLRVCSWEEYIDEGDREEGRKG